MFRRILLLSTICGLVRSSGVTGDSLAQAAGAPIAQSPVVTAASSQYFQRTFNRLVVPPVVIPGAPIVPPPIAPVATIAPTPTVFIEPTNTLPLAANPPIPQEIPVQPNVAIAVATAHAAAPVATILLPPYPFGFPPTFEVVPSEQPTIVPVENTKETTTQKTTVAVTTTSPQTESTTPLDTSNSDNGFVQALPSNENVNFKLYGTPPREQRPQEPLPQFRPQLSNQNLQPQLTNGQFRPRQPNVQFQPQRPQFQTQQPQFPPYPPHQQPGRQFQPFSTPLPQLRPQIQPKPQQSWPRQKPMKLKTSVEVVPVPLTYITPPPLQKTHAHVKIVKHIYSFVPSSSEKIILKPIKIRPVRLVKNKFADVHRQDLRANARDIEVTTFNPFLRRVTRPPRV